jgi:UDP-glucose 4-epimerase
MQIVITGAGGFIGRALSLRLAGEGHRIVALDNDFRGTLASIAEHARITRQPCDVLRPDDLRRAFAGADAVYHLAAINGTENFYRIPDKVLEVGIIGTHNALKAALANDVRRFYLASSSEVYETASTIPTPESVPCSVSDVFNPRHSYGGSKIAGELMTINYLRGTPTQFVIFRPHNVYGPRMGFEHVIPQLVRSIVDQIDRRPDARSVTIPLQGSGRETRAFIYIDDGVRAIEAGTLGNPDGGLIHIGHDVETPIAELAVRIGGILGVEVEPRPGPGVAGSPSRRCPDTSRLRRLGFQPRVSLAEGLETTVRWYAEHYRAAGASRPGPAAREHRATEA